MLLRYGADINKNVAVLGTLQAACTSGGIEIVHFLLRSGAHVNAEHGFYGTALQATSPYIPLQNTDEENTAIAWAFSKRQIDGTLRIIRLGKSLETILRPAVYIGIGDK